MRKLTFRFEVAITEESYNRIFEKLIEDEKKAPASCRQAEERKTAFKCRDTLNELLGDLGSEVVSTGLSETEVNLSETNEK